ncbi:MAG: DUF998 domain-containing protein [Candidatus Brockarchaeota archaeon]|nr:DUF998 domain-containing protein [Candidatus Brockarchaeota archaeon]
MRRPLLWSRIKSEAGGNGATKLRFLGVLGAVSAYPFIIASIALSPWFNFCENALSDLGNVALNGSVAVVYNAGMVASGLIVAAFGTALSIKHPSWKYLVWSLPLAVAGFDLALIGVFPEDAGAVHGQVSVVFFASIAAVTLLYSYASWPLGTPRVGAASLALGIASPLVWFFDWPWRGVAIQETITSAFAAVWLVMVSLSNA